MITSRQQNRVKNQNIVIENLIENVVKFEYLGVMVTNTRHSQSNYTRSKHGKCILLFTLELEVDDFTRCQSECIGEWGTAMNVT